MMSTLGTKTDSSATLSTKNLTRNDMGLKLGLRCEVYCTFWLPHICGVLVPHFSFNLPISFHLWPSLDVCVETEVSFFTSYPYSDPSHILVTNCPTSRISFPPRSPCIPPLLFVVYSYIMQRQNRFGYSCTTSPPCLREARSQSSIAPMLLSTVTIRGSTCLMQMIYRMSSLSCHRTRKLYRMESLHSPNVPWQLPSSLKHFASARPLLISPTSERSTCTSRTFQDCIIFSITVRRTGRSKLRWEDPWKMKIQN